MRSMLDIATHAFAVSAAGGIAAVFFSEFHPRDASSHVLRGAPAISRA